MRILALYINAYHLSEETDEFTITAGSKKKLVKAERMSVNPNLINPIKIKLDDDCQEEDIKFSYKSKKLNRQVELFDTKIKSLLHDHEHNVELSNGSMLKFLALQGPELKKELQFSISFEGNLEYANYYYMRS